MKFGASYTPPTPREIEEAMELNLRKGLSPRGALAAAPAQLRGAGGARCGGPAARGDSPASSTASVIFMADSPQTWRDTSSTGQTSSTEEESEEEDERLLRTRERVSKEYLAGLGQKDTRTRPRAKAAAADVSSPGSSGSGRAGREGGGAGSGSGGSGSDGAGGWDRRRSGGKAAAGLASQRLARQLQGGQPSPRQPQQWKPPRAAPPPAPPAAPRLRLSPRAAAALQAPAPAPAPARGAAPAWEAPARRQRSPSPLHSSSSGVRVRTWRPARRSAAALPAADSSAPAAPTLAAAAATQPGAASVAAAATAPAAAAAPQRAGAGAAREQPQAEGAQQQARGLQAKAAESRPVLMRFWRARSRSASPSAASRRAAANAAASAAPARAAAPAGGPALAGGGPAAAGARQASQPSSQTASRATSPQRHHASPQTAPARPRARSATPPPATRPPRPTPIGLAEDDQQVQPASEKLGSGPFSPLVRIWKEPPVVTSRVWASSRAASRTASRERTPERRAASRERSPGREAPGRRSRPASPKPKSKLAAEHASAPLSPAAALKALPGVPPEEERPEVEARNPDLYSLLGVDMDADMDEIRKAFLRQAVRRHPDKGGDEENFQALVQAKKVLTDPKLRQVYDYHGLERVEKLLHDRREALNYANTLMAVMEAGGGNVPLRTWCNCFQEMEEMVEGAPPEVQAWFVGAESLVRLAELHRTMEARNKKVDERAEVLTAFAKFLCAAFRKRGGGAHAPQLLPDLAGLLGELGRRRAGEVESAAWGRVLGPRRLGLPDLALGGRAGDCEGDDGEEKDPRQPLLKHMGTVIGKLLHTEQAMETVMERLDSKFGLSPGRGLPVQAAAAG